MAKVIVERPRRKGWAGKRPKGYSRRLRAFGADGPPPRDGIKARWRGGSKRLNEHLGPLRRYLMSQVGRPWDKVFAEISPGLADGFRLDIDGNLWTSAGDGVHCYSPAGELLGKIKVPEVVSNVAFGGPQMDQLFITGGTGPEAGEGGLFRIDLGVTGFVILPPRR